MSHLFKKKTEKEGGSEREEGEIYEEGEREKRQKGGEREEREAMAGRKKGLMWNTGHDMAVALINS